MSAICSNAFVNIFVAIALCLLHSVKVHVLYMGNTREFAIAVKRVPRTHVPKKVHRRKFQSVQLGPEWHNAVRSFAKELVAKRPLIAFHEKYPVCVATGNARPRPTSVANTINHIPMHGQYTNITGTLAVGVRYYAPNQKSFVEVREGNNLVVDASEVAGVIWQSGPHPRVRSTRFRQGNLEMRAGKTLLWRTDASDHSYEIQGAYLLMENDGNLTIYSKSGDIMWKTRYRPLLGTYTQITGALVKNHPFTPPNGQTILVFTEGDLFLTRQNGKIVFRSYAHHGHSCHMREDGNLVILNKDKVVVWSTKTSGHENAYLTLQDDGDMVIYTRQGDVRLWASNTAFNKHHPRDTFSCNRMRADYVASLRSSINARKASSRPILGDGQKLLDSLQRHTKFWLLGSWQAIALFKKFRFVEAWDMFAFRETWTDIDTEELQLLDGGENLFVHGPLTTATFAQRLPSVNDLKDLLTKRNVAIVGNGKTLLDQGKAIDNHSVIVRFNDMVGSALTRNRTGLQTHVHVVHSKIRKNAGPGVILFDLEGRDTWRSYCRRYSWDNDLQKTYLVRPSARCAMLQFDSWTRGFLFYWLLGSLFEHVDIYGMGVADGRTHDTQGHVMKEPYLDFEHDVYRTAETLITAANSNLR